MEEEGGAGVGGDNVVTLIVLEKPWVTRPLSYSGYL